MMSFSAKQLQTLRRDLSDRYVRTRQGNGRELSYIEGWHAIAEANRIFGFDGWDRETVESRCVMSREMRGTFHAVYTAKVRIRVRAGRATIVREGHGSGEARTASPGETHDLALKGAETDATKRALATFGKPFGLALHLSGKAVRANMAIPPAPAPAAPEAAKPAQGEQQASRTNDPRMVVRTHNDWRTNLSKAAASSGIDKSVLTFGEPRRQRDKEHLKFVAAQPCLLCGRTPADAHHLRFAQPQALGRKVSDEFTVPLCRTHHRQVHHSGNETAWWQDMSIDPVPIANTLWQETRAKLALNSSSGENRLVEGPAGNTDQERSRSGRDARGADSPNTGGSSGPQ